MSLEKLMKISEEVQKEHAFDVYAALCDVVDSYSAFALKPHEDVPDRLMHEASFLKSFAQAYAVVKKIQSKIDRYIQRDSEGDGGNG